MHKLTSLKPVYPLTKLAKKNHSKKEWWKYKILYVFLMSITSREITQRRCYQANIREQYYKKIKIIIF